MARTVIAPNTIWGDQINLLIRALKGRSVSEYDLSHKSNIQHSEIYSFYYIPRIEFWAGTEGAVGT
jgi:hypothetical protein